MVAAEVTRQTVACASQEVRLVTSAATGPGDFQTRSEPAKIAHPVVEETRNGQKSLFCGDFDSECGLNAFERRLGEKATKPVHNYTPARMPALPGEH